jgi:hypothetical protein
LVFLDACFSKIQAEIIRSEVDYVIGMNRAILETTATMFASTFYSAVASDVSFREAFNQAKVMIECHHPDEVETPELLMRNDEVEEMKFSRLIALKKSSHQDADSIETLEHSIENEKQIIKNLLIQLAYSNEKFQALAYLVLPKISKTLPISIDEILDKLYTLEEADNRLSIPIYCLVKKLYTEHEEEDFLFCLESIRQRHPQLKELEPECIDNVLDDSYNILVEITTKNKEAKDSTITIWEDKVLLDNETSYQIVKTFKHVNLDEPDEVNQFVTDLGVYLNKFSQDRNRLLLEFILPEELLSYPIKDWEDCDEFRLSEDFSFVYRLQNRFINYSKYSAYWKGKWKESLENTEVNVLSEKSFVLSSESEGKRINKDVSFSLITEFPIAKSTIFKRIYRYGVPIVLSPHNTLSQEELERFNSRFQEEFKNTTLRELVKKVNVLFGEDSDALESKMILIWDNPNRVPLQYQKPQDTQLGL